MENIKATVSNNYKTSNKLTVNITGSAEGSSDSRLTMSIVDNDDSFNALAKDSSIPFGDTSKSYYVTATYVSNSRDVVGLAGTLDVTKYEENTNSKTAIPNPSTSPVAVAVLSITKTSLASNAVFSVALLTRP